jgi:hypothetical protein
MDLSGLDLASLDAHELSLAAASAGDFPLAENLLRFILGSVAADPGVRANLGTVLLAQGRYAEGAPLYEARLARQGAPPSPGLGVPRWRGEPLDGKRVLIWPEQGLGDQIMFARFVPELQQRGCDLTFVCRPPLIRLLSASLSARILPAEGRIEFPDPDVWLWSSSLLAASGATLETIPGEPYLRWPTARSGPYRIGVATRGRATHANDAHRSLPGSAAEDLLSLPGAMSLLPEDTGARDMADTAELIAGLDLVISVDTSIAHLAGALGKRVWILLPAVRCDWRWLTKRDDSPWYRSARLFRQDTPGDWEGVLQRVRQALADL